MKHSLSDTQSRAVKILVFLATVLVVMRHGQNLHHFYPGGSPWMPVCDFNVFIQRFISELTAVAIPCFFTVSGFLFFVGLKDHVSIGAKLRRRFKTLLIPFLLWNILFITLWISLYGLVPSLRGQLIHSFGINFSPLWFVKNLTVDPIVGQFWYIRTLILFCLFTPVMLLSYRSKIVSIMVLALLMRNWQAVDCRVFSTEGIFCFYLGGLIGYNEWHEGMRYGRYSWLLLPVIAGMIVNDILQLGLPRCWYLRIFLSVTALCQIALFLAERPCAGVRLAAMNKHSFFIYAVHGSVLAALSLLLSRTAAHTPLNSLGLYVFCVVVTIFIAIGLARVLKKILPAFYAILTGGR